jgi:hypothetical protein
VHRAEDARLADLRAARFRPGPLVAACLAGAWRAAPPPLALPAGALPAIAPLLLRSGAGALAWYRLRGSPLAGTATAEGLHDAYCVHALEAEVHALRLLDVLGRLTRAGVAALLVKGWAIARAYPEVGLRPYTDLDLVVPREQGPAARAALREGPPLDVAVDLHEGPARVDAEPFHVLWARSEVVPLQGTPLRVLGPEDHLRVLALHALRHGVFRPIWLVDLAVAVETRPPGFDWARCLGPDRRRAEWVRGALGLAGRLLGARLEGTPVAAAPARLPGWLVSTVLRSWDRCEGVSHRERVFPALLAALREPWRLREEVRLRWDRPIQATLDVRGPFNALPRLPFQLAAAALRVPELVRALREARRHVARRRARTVTPGGAVRDA